MLHRLIPSARTASCRSRRRLLSKCHPHPQLFRPPKLFRPPANNGSGNEKRWHGGGPGPDAPTVDITFVNPDDSRATVSARVGETLLQASHRTGMDMEGACEGVCACSTCHVVLEQELYDRLLDRTEDGALDEDEEDMLDMAFGLEHTSRLGCQVKIEGDMEGSTFTLPKATRNFYVDGHKPIPH